MSSTSTASLKSGRTRHLSRNGKNQVSKDSAVYSVYIRVILILERAAYAECRKITWRRRNRLSARNAGAKDVPVETDK